MMAAMCGRFVARKPPQEIARWFRTTGVPPNYPPRYNIAPTDEVLTVRYNPEDGLRHLNALRWGLVPIWAKDRKGAAKLINARSETAATLTTFKDAYAKRRCLIPADGFYEWRVIDDKTKEPFAIMPADDPLFAFAGLWERWRDPATKEIVRSCTILTTTANELLRPIHERMPVILDETDWSRWLGESDSTPDELRALLRPYPADRMRTYRITSRVNSVKNDDEAVLAAL
jgi:putative SOS response-associated peptidase YedK